jgi:EcsC protein family
MARESRAATAAYLKKAMDEIAAWENPRRGIFQKLGDAVFNPAARWTTRMIPKPVQGAAAQAVEKTLLLSARVGALGIDSDAIERDRRKRIGLSRGLVPRLKACDELAVKHWRTHCGYAAAQGAATGLAGLAGLVADLPLLISNALRSIRTIGLSYGFSARTPHEHNYILHVLRAGSSTEPAVRAESIAVLRQLEADERSGRPGDEAGSRLHYLMTVEQYAKSLAIDMIRRNLLQAVPISSIVTGASFNAAYLHDVGRAAYCCYRRRFIEGFPPPPSRSAKTRKSNKQ